MALDNNFAGISQGIELMLGGSGPQYITGTGNNTGQRWFAVMALTDSVFTALDGMNGFSSGMPLRANSWLYNLNGFTRIQLTSGSVVAYRL